MESKLTYHKGKLVSEDEMMNFDMILKWLYTSVNMEIGQVLVCPNKMPQKIDMLKRV